MTTCKAYQHQIDKGSPLFPLLEAVHAADVSDRDLDAGYEELDYTKPGQWGALHGVGDCTIDRREVARYAADRWQAFRGPLAQWTGKPIPWDMSVEGLAKKTDETIAARAKLLRTAEKAIGAIRLDLADAKIDPASDAGRELMARALFWWYRFPTAETIALLEKPRFKAVIASFDKAKALGLGRFWSTLLTEGGAGVVFDETSTVKRVQRPFLLAIYGIPDTTASGLFGLFDVAGLTPTFVEIPDVTSEAFHCDEPMVPHYGVAVAVSGKLRAFDPIDQSGKEPAIFFPVGKRQFLAAQLSFATFNLALELKRFEDDEDSFSPGDGMMPAFVGLVQIPKFKHLLGAAKGLVKDDAKWMEQSLQLLLKNKSAYHPYLHFILQHLARGFSEEGEETSQVVKEIIDHPAWKGLPLTKAYLTSGYADLEKAIPAGEYRLMAEELLDLDAGCAEAHLALARMGGGDDAAAMSPEVDAHFATALAGMSPETYYASALLLRWARLDVKRNRRKEAKGKFAQAAAVTLAPSEWRTNSFWELAILQAEDGQLKDAAASLKGVADIIAEDLQKELDVDRAKSWITWLADKRKEHPLSASATGDASVKEVLLLLSCRYASLLLFTGRLGEAREEVTRSLAMNFNDPTSKLLQLLHEIHVREGRFDEANRVWTKIVEKYTSHTTPPERKTP